VPVVHSPDSAYAKEITKWEAKDGTLGPGLRPYVHRPYPMMLHKAAALPSGGIEIIATEIVQTDDERAKVERMGFRATPLEAIEALKAEQLEHATLSAERNYEKLHKLSPRAVAEVEAKEEAAGAVHLPTIDETPHGLRGEHVTSDREIALQAEVERLKAEIVRDRATTPIRRRGRPKKVTT
jgi:hypothetical protein